MSNISENQEEVPGQWLIRPCEEYSEELSYCRSWFGRLNQRYVLGDKIDCEPIGQALHNCMYWLQRKDAEALKNLITYEQDRQIRRLLAADINTIWKPRSTPPSDWNAPLPDWAKKRAEDIGKHASH